MATPVLDNLDLSGNQLLNVVLQLLPSDPSSPAEGQIWYDSVNHLYKYRDSTGTRVIAYLSEVVQSVTAADSTLTVGGTSTAPTVKVAKALDHTWITDFDAEVRVSRLDQMAAPTSSLSLNGNTAINLADPVNPTDAVNLRTLLNNVAGLSASQPVSYASAAALPGNTYSNGASGVGATLTASANGALSLDGVAVASGQRVLIANEATAANNGIYVVTATGGASAPYVLTRAVDFNASSNIGPGILIPVEASGTGGTQNNGRIFLSICSSSPTLGTSSISFSSVGSTYSAGTGLSLSGTTFSLPTVTVALGGTGATTAAGARTNLGATTKYATTIGDGSTLAYTVNHALGTNDVHVQVFESSGSKRLVIVDSAVVDSNNVTVTFASAPASGAYRAVVIA